MAPFFGPKIGETKKKKGLRCKMIGFSVQKYVKTKKKKKKKVFAAKSVGLGKERYSPQISGVMVSHHNMVSPQNSETRSGPPPPPSDATALRLRLGIPCDVTKYFSFALYIFVTYFLLHCKLL